MGRENANSSDEEFVDSKRGLSEHARRYKGRTAKCQVPGCKLALSDKIYYLRYKICSHHSSLPSVTVNGVQQRWCQQCGRFHDLASFDGDRKTCRAKLNRHNSRRKTARGMSRTCSGDAPAAVPQSATAPAADHEEAQESQEQEEEQQEQQQGSQQQQGSTKERAQEPSQQQGSHSGAHSHCSGYSSGGQSQQTGVMAVLGRRPSVESAAQSGGRQLKRRRQPSPLPPVSPLMTARRSQRRRKLALEEVSDTEDHQEQQEQQVPRQLAEPVSGGSTPIQLLVGPASPRLVPHTTAAGATAGVMSREASIDSSCKQLPAVPERTLSLSLPTPKPVQPQLLPPAPASPVQLRPLPAAFPRRPAEPAEPFPQPAREPLLRPCSPPYFSLPAAAERGADGEDDGIMLCYQPSLPGLLEPEPLGSDPSVCLAAPLASAQASPRGQQAASELHLSPPHGASQDSPTCSMHRAPQSPPPAGSSFMKSIDFRPTSSFAQVSQALPPVAATPASLSLFSGAGASSTWVSSQLPSNNLEELLKALSSEPDGPPASPVIHMGPSALWTSTAVDLPALQSLPESLTAAAAGGGGGGGGGLTPTRAGLDIFSLPPLAAPLAGPVAPEGATGAGAGASEQASPSSWHWMARWQAASSSVAAGAPGAGVEGFGARPSLAAGPCGAQLYSPWACHGASA